MLAKPRTASAFGSLRRKTWRRHYGCQRTAGHPDVAKSVDGADDARATVLAGPGLNRGEDRNGEQAGGGRIEENLERDAQRS
jgi:hypothetical protein